MIPTFHVSLDHGHRFDMERKALSFTTIRLISLFRSCTPSLHSPLFSRVTPQPQLYTQRRSCTVVQATEQYSGNPRSPVVILPGLGNAASDYADLATKLQQRGHASVTIAPIRRWQWSLNARGFFSSAYWRSKLTPSPVLDWYFSRVHAIISEVVAVHEGPINIVGHSAGGWLACVYLAERSDPLLRVRSLVTLGTPHVAPPAGTLDQTRGLLTYVNTLCDVADRVDNFICVAGQGTQGRPLGQGSFRQYLAYISYAAVCGKGSVDGDGVTPVQAACARNARLIQCACDHSMLTSPSNWYGSDNVLACWADHLS